MQEVSRRQLLLAGAGLTTSFFAGCSGDDGEGDNAGTTDPANRGPVSVAELAFAADRPDDLDEYEPQSESTYAPDQPIWLYADFSGLAGEPIDSGGDGGDADAATVAIDFQQTLVVEDPDGNQVIESQETFQEELSPQQLEGYYTGTEILLAGRAATGEYAATLSVTDRVSETQASETATFRIEE